MVAQFSAAMWDGAPIPDTMNPSVMTAFAGPSRQTVILASSMKKLGGSIAQSAIATRKGIAPAPRTLALDVWTRKFGRNSPVGPSILTWGVTPFDDTNRIRIPLQRNHPRQLELPGGSYCEPDHLLKTPYHRLR
ncbi:hypothetical protein V8E54_000619 [Elaphomyces granulatus]